MDQAQTIAANWEKLGIVGLCVLAVALMVFALYKMLGYMLTRFDETTKSLREEIGRREDMIKSYNENIVKLTSESTAAHQRALDVIERNTTQLQRCAAVQQIKQI